MKGYHIYFSITATLLIFSLFLPVLTFVDGYAYDNDRTISYYNRLGPVVLLIALAPTVLLLISNRITALIGTVSFFAITALALISAGVLIIDDENPITNPGIGAYLVIISSILCLTLSIIRTVHLFRKVRNTEKEGIIDHLEF